MSEELKPDGYAYRYPDGYIRHSDGREINGSSPSQVLPWVYTETVAKQIEAAAALADAVDAYNMQKLLWKPAPWGPVAEALAAYRAAAGRV